MATDHVRKLPLFWGHGTRDPLVLFPSMGRASADFLLRELGVKLAADEGDATGLSFHGYEGVVHSACEEELDDLRVWLKRVIPETKSEK